jgi:signal transduction histidine kinase
MARLATRSAELERLSVRLLQEQEAQRRRIGRELHDETAQIFSALKLHLGSLREESSSEARERVDRLLEWVDRGSASIRAATEGLRPAVLDDLGLLPALRSLVADFREWSGLAVTFDAAPTLPTARSGMSPAADLALFRALQEALSNVLRHAQAHGVVITLGETPGGLRLIVADDGIAREAMTVTTFLGPGRSGLVGMRERLAAVGGTLRLSTDGTGLTLTVDVPMGTA